jgi:hypothetical protein
VQAKKKIAAIHSCYLCDWYAFPYSRIIDKGIVEIESKLWLRFAEGFDGEPGVCIIPVDDHELKAPTWCM